MLTSQEIIAADVLRDRPVAPRDHQREAQALDRLIARIAGDPGMALQALVETVVEVTGAGSAGISILQDDRFVWPAIAGEWARYAGNGMPLDASPCGIVIERNHALLFDEPHGLFPGAWGDPPIREILLVPLSSGTAPFGTLWVLNHGEGRFDSENARILERLGLFAAAIAQGRPIAQPVAEDPTAEAHDRVRRTLQIMRSIINRVRGDENGPPAGQVAAELGSRFSAYAEPILRKGTAERAHLWLLLADALRDRGEREGERVKLSGPTVALSPDLAALVSLAVHELIDNAFRFGALSADGGHVDLAWRSMERDGREWLSLSWRETHPARIFMAPADEGFGFDLLRSALPRLCGGSTTLSAQPPGLFFEWHFPLERTQGPQA